MELSRELRRIVRRIAGIGRYGWTGIPVEVVDGSNPPRVAGDYWHYETRGGRRIYHPTAYSKKGWSNMVYVHSTRRVEVGKDWLNSA
jgi:hypothetical protein